MQHSTIFIDTDSGDGNVAVWIADANSPVTGGAVLEVTAAIESRGSAELMRDVDLVVGNDPEIVDNRVITVPASATERFTLTFETYPVVQDDSFPIRVETGERSDDRTVTAYGTEP